LFQLELGGSFDAHDVLYVPRLKNNFLSVSTMEDMGFVVTFLRGKLLICPEKAIPNIAVVIGVREGTLFMLQGKPIQDLVHDNDNLCELWTKRP
jgi:hypothetical protein